MENNVVTLETAKKLKAAGFEQKSAWHWYFYQKQWRLGYIGPVVWDDTNLAAPTAQELADQFKGIGMVEIKMSRHNNQSVSAWLNIQDMSGRLVYGAGDTMAEALAALYLKLKEAL